MLLLMLLLIVLLELVSAAQLVLMTAATSNSREQSPDFVAAAEEVGVGFSDSTIFLISVFGFGILSFIIYKVMLSKLKTNEEIQNESNLSSLDYDEQLIQSDVNTLNRAQRRARAKAIMKQKRSVTDNTQQIQGEQQHDRLQLMNEDEEHREGLRREDHENIHDENLSRKDRQKVAKLIEKEERKQNEELRRKKQIELQEIAKKEKMKREKLLLQQVEEEKLERQLFEKQQEQKMYEEWKFLFPRSNSNDNNITVDQFIQYMQQQKQKQQENIIEKKPKKSEIFDDNLLIIPLKDLMLLFYPNSNDSENKEILQQQHTQALDIIKQRLREIISSGRLTGVIDEKNSNFIYISDDQMLQLSKHIIAKDNNSNNSQSPNDIPGQLNINQLAKAISASCT